jgi:hypothetical protein
MAVVDILQIAPPDEHWETVPFGGSELKIRALKLSQIARIAQRFDGFRKVYFTSDDDGPGDRLFRAAAMMEAYPAIIVAGLGKDGLPDSRLVEAHIERFSRAEIGEVARAVLRLTNGQDEPDEDEPKDDKRPLTEGAAVPPAAGAETASTLSSAPSSI